MGQVPPAEKVLALLLDHETKQRMFFTKDMLTNQLNRDAPRIASSFDRVCGAELEAMSRVLSLAMTHLFVGMRTLDADNKTRWFCFHILFNAAQSFSAGVALLRDGYRLQPGILVRSILETVSAALHLMMNPGDVTKFESGELSSQKAVSSAKKIVPPLGQAYGFFSDHFAHIGAPHQMLQSHSPYESRQDEDLDFNLMCLKWSIWLIYVVTELLFFDRLPSSRYWKKVGPNQYAYAPSMKEREWLAQFLERPRGGTPNGQPAKG